MDNYIGGFTDLLNSSAEWDPSESFPKDFWSNKVTWLRHDPLLNLEEVRTPLLQSVHGQVFNRAYAWLVNGFGHLERPIELIHLPTAGHQPRRPQELMALRQVVTDWLCFWLKLDIPSEAERAARWAILRKQQDEVLKTPPPPKGKWVFQPDPVQPEWHPTPETEKEEPKPEPTGANQN